MTQTLHRLWSNRMFVCWLLPPMQPVSKEAGASSGSAKLLVTLAVTESTTGTIAPFLAMRTATNSGGGAAGGDQGHAQLGAAEVESSDSEGGDHGSDGATNRPASPTDLHSKLDSRWAAMHHEANGYLSIALMWHPGLCFHCSMSPAMACSGATHDSRTPSPRQTLAGRLRAATPAHSAQTLLLCCSVQAACGGVGEDQLL
jgi:hypothetical protein